MVAGAGEDAAAGAGLGAAADNGVSVEEAGLLAVSVVAAAGAFSAEDFGLALPYPSAYQPPPLKAMAGAEITRSMGPPQWGHVVISGSENF